LAYQISTRYLNPRLRYYYFRFLRTNGCHIEILLPAAILTFTVIVIDSTLAYQILSKFDDIGRSYDVILILQDDGHSVANLFPVSALATFYILKGLKLTVIGIQISKKYLNPRPRYYYFRFLKTNGHHIEILLPVSILTFPLPSACCFPPASQISSLAKIV